MALQKTGYRKVRSGLTISRRDSDYMTATYSGIDPELRRLSRAGAFGVDGHVGNTPLIRLRHLLAMVRTNGIHIAHAPCVFFFVFEKCDTAVCLSPIGDRPRFMLRGTPNAFASRRSAWHA